ncbi:O-antigen ligase family protein [Planococcus sp. A6]|uniref:O-antigen ligase family protein n=1 Tax=Planococcus sp. A6 TaxID=2992760 RepID=UPI00237AAAC7|nr:O-antigen ligase family protein [Planococcus sp. A6]MDE0582098.1 O-antigen ligase family protein [Planococcus sp. A6]
MNLDKGKIITLLLGFYLLLLPWDIFLKDELLFPISPSFFPLGILFFVFIVTLFHFNSFKFPHHLSILMLLICYSTLSLLWSTTKEHNVNELITLISYYVTVLVIYNLMSSYKISYKFLLWAYIAGTVSVGLFSISYFDVPSRRLTISEESNPTMYAAFLVWAIVSSSVLYKYETTKSKILLSISVIIMIILLMMTQGRNSILALMFSFVSAYIYLFIKERLGKRSKARKVFFLNRVKNLFLLVIITSTSLYFLVKLHLFERLDNIRKMSEVFSGNLNSVTSGRTVIWENYINILDASILVGNGIGGATFKYAEVYNIGLAPHNTYILLLVELGVVGLIIWIVFIAEMLKVALNNKKEKFALLSLILIFIFLGFGNDIIYYKYWWQGLLIFLIIYNLSKVDEKDVNANT